MLTQPSPTAPSGSSEIHESGEQITVSQPGSLFCVGCGFAFSIASLDALPECPHCGGARFRRASLFARPTPELASVETAEKTPDWIDEVREGLTPGCHCLAFERLDGEVDVVELETGWTRIGRSSIADVRLDDATVSRRHALVVLTDDGELKALDDRSLNGLFVNGERVEWAPLADGDELEIGRYRFFVLEA
ncbi:MAG TPA: FHA domain-containing protein [Solirubrobacterales bacterium]|nr:FHA domain-containing protein [Solirubrobacterales bacterium]